MVKVISTVHVGDEYEGEYGTKLVAHIVIPDDPIYEPEVASIDCINVEEAEQVVKMYNDARDLGMSHTLSQTLSTIRES